MIQGFREFILKGNVVDLAVAVVIGAAFGALITSFVANILTPLLGLIGIPDFSAVVTTLPSGATINWGLFLNALISFVLIALAIYVFVISPMNALERRRQRGTEETPSTKTCTECASEIPAVARRCPMCTQPQA
jgi:large conductance mechanosensitive channel